MTDERALVQLRRRVVLAWTAAQLAAHAGLAYAGSDSATRDSATTGGATTGVRLTFAKIEGNGVVDAIARQVLLEAYEKLNIHIEFREYPGKRALLESSSGRLDGEMQRRDKLTAEFPDLLQVRVAINTIDICVFSRTTEFTPNGWESLRPYTIGYHRGILAIEEGTRGMQTDPADSNLLLLRKLASGRTDVVVMTESDGLELMNQANEIAIHKLWPPVAQIHLYHYLHRRHAELVPRLESVLAAMERAGRIEHIRQAAYRASHLPFGAPLTLPVSP